MTLDCAVVVTSSGAPAILDRTSGEVMHPIVGPLVESERLYVTPAGLAARLAQPSAEPLVLLDVGLGAGANGAAAWRVAQAHSARRRLLMLSFDRSTTALKLALECEHARELGLDESTKDAARSLLRDGRCETEKAEWRFHEGELPETLRHVPAEGADVVFWDPFSPLANPELWSLSAFLTLRRHCRAGATVHTYCAATRVRSALLLAGFKVGLGEAISPDKDATVAALDPAELERPLSQRWLARLKRSSAPLPGDAPADAIERISLLPQFRNESGSR